MDREEDKHVTPLLELPMTPRLRRWACLSCAVDAQTTPRPREELPPHPGPQTGNGCDAPEGMLLPFTPEVPREGKQQQWSLSVPRFQPFSPISRHSKQQFSRLQPLSQQTRSSLNGGLGQGEGCHSEPWESLGSEEGLPSSLTSPLSPCAPTYPHLP